MYIKSVIFILVAAVYFDSTFACNGYKAKVNRVVDCGGENQVINIDEGFTVKLDKKCRLVPTGCITSKGFTKAKVTYQVAKDGVVVKEGTSDACDVISSANEEAKNVMKVFAMPDHCPVSEGKICATDETKADLSKYKNMLSMAKGQIHVNATVEHENGGQSCFHLEFEIYK